MADDAEPGAAEPRREDASQPTQDAVPAPGWPPPPPPYAPEPLGGTPGWAGAPPVGPGAPQWPAGAALPPAAWSPWGYAPQPHPAPRQRGRGLAIAAIIMSSIALLAVLLLAVVALAFPFTGSASGNVTLGAGEGLGGGSLEQAVRSALTTAGSEVSAMDCPDTETVDQGVVSICHGTMDGSDWNFVVFFESASGNFTVAVL